MNSNTNILKGNIILIILCLLMALCHTKTSNAQLPLITDDASVQEKGNSQIELCNGVGYHSIQRCMIQSSMLTTSLTYGCFEKTDLILSYPFMFVNTHSDSTTDQQAGFSDLYFEVKHILIKKNVFSAAIKPGFSFPTGDYKIGLGSGSMSVSLFFLMTLDWTKVKTSMNAGFMTNHNRCGDAMNIWHFSLDADYYLKKQFHIVINSGIEKNPDQSFIRPIVFGLLGFYIPATENCTISAGYKRDFCREETAHSFLYGLTITF